jgi:hypothetical protein
MATANKLGAVVRSRVCELVRTLELFVVTSCKSSLNQIINPNPFYSPIT